MFRCADVQCTSDTMPEMKLPDDEVKVLVSCSGDPLRARVRALREAGWTLAAIADAWTPPKQRSSIRALSQQPTKSPLPIVPSPPPSSSHSSHLAAAERSRSRHSRARRFYNPSSPKISNDDAKRIAQLAPLARRYRARANPTGSYAQANEELTQLCISLYRAGASVIELAAAANVTYRAMARRIGVGK
jgi:hypothetical protein